MSEIIELQKIYSEEALRYRQHLELQFKRTIWGVGILVTVFGVAFSFIFGRTVEVAKIQRIVDYYVNEEIQNEIEMKLQIDLDNELKGAKARIEQEVDAKVVESIEGQTKTKIESAAQSFLDTIGERGTELWKDVVDLPVGTILVYAGKTSPNDNWLICNGASIPHGEEYNAIRNILSGHYGRDKLPDFRGRTPIGERLEDTTAWLTRHKLGERTGEENHQLTISEIPTHRHKQSLSGGVGSDTGYPHITGQLWSNNAGAIGTKFTSYEGAGLAHNNMQPSLVVNFIIKVK